jgi:hypothetical protein
VREILHVLELAAGDDVHRVVALVLFVGLGIVVAGRARAARCRGSGRRRLRPTACRSRRAHPAPATSALPCEVGDADDGDRVHLFLGGARVAKCG